MAAGEARRIRIVAGMGEAVIDAQFDAAANDLGFCQADQRGMDVEPRASFDARLGRQIGQGAEGGDELRAAIGIAAVVHGVDAQKDVGRAEHLGVGQRQREQDRVRAGT